MAWRRGKAKAKEASPPAVAPDLDSSEMLPVLRDEGTTHDREAYKQIKQAEADLKKLEKNKTKAQKKEEKRIRRLDRDIARYAMSRNLGPVQLVVTVAVFNGIAAAMAMLLLWWPDLLPLDRLLAQDNAHLIVIVLCFLASAVASIFLLSRNPSSEYIYRAQYSFGIYFAFGLIGAFTGMLMAYVLVDMGTLDIDWVFWQWIFVYLIAGSSILMVIIYLIVHRAGSRSFLTGAYHQVMGSLNAILVVSLVLLPIFYLPYQGWMYEVGISIMYIGWLLMLFPVPAIAAAIMVKHQAAELRKAMAAY